MKHCPRCGEWKQTEGFSRNKRRPDGLQSECKDCRRDMKRGRSNHAANIRRRFNITPADYKALEAAAGGCCEICGATAEENGKRLAVDHCHTTGRIRGLLCKSCNTGLGHFKDNTKFLSAAISYLSA